MQFKGANHLFNSSWERLLGVTLVYYFMKEFIFNSMP